MCLYVMLCVSTAAAQEGVEASPAQGLSGVTNAAPGDEVQIYSVELQDGTPGFDTVPLGWPGNNNGIELIIDDLSVTTGFTTSDIASLRLYRSSDNVFDGGDVLVAQSGALAPLGGATTLDATGAGANRNLDVTPASTFFVATAVISIAAQKGHAFTVETQNPHIGLDEPTFGGHEIGSAIVANDANHVAIGASAVPAKGGASIPFGGEPAMLCLLLGTGAWVLWRRA